MVILFQDLEMREIEYMEQNKKENNIKTIIDEFKEFIKRGNVIDLAVAFIMGQAFTAIVNSLVNDIIMPLVGILIGGINFTNIKVTLGDATIYYGLFIQNVINFLIIAACIFLVVKIMNKFMAKKIEKKEEKPKKSDETKLLEEILKELKDKKD